MTEDRYKRLLELASSQMDALKEGRYEEAVKLNEQRQEIIDKLQATDAPPSKDTPATMAKILSIDAEMQGIIQAGLGILKGKAADLKKARAFCRTAAPRQSKGKLDISA